jgi:hypothetical protein
VRPRRWVGAGPAEAAGAAYADGVPVGTVHIDHPDVRECVVSAHCVKRFRERMPVREPGLAEVATALRAALEGADVMRWPPAWAVSDRPAPWWAVNGDVAFPLAPTPKAGRWLAVTCLRRPTGSRSRS